jgi:DGQHR domain-containing protein
VRAHEIRKKFYPSYELASHDADESFDAKTQMMFHVTVSQQGDREHIMASLPMKEVAEIATNRRETAAGERYNRTPSASHVKGIQGYLVEQVSRRKTYILPPITMAIGAGDCVPMTLYLTQSVTRSCKIGILVMNRPYSEDQRFPILDGQHRVLAIKGLVAQAQDPNCDPIIAEIPNDSIQVILVNETDIEQIHTDFVNLACTKPITKGLKVSWDRNNRLAVLSGELATGPLRSKVELESTVAKQDSMLTISQVMLTLSELAQGKGGLKSQKQLADELRNPDRYDELHQLGELFFEVLRDKTEAVIGEEIDNYDRFKDLRRSSLFLIGSVAQTIARAVFKIGGSFEDKKEMIRFFYSLDFERYEAERVHGELVVNRASPFLPNLLTETGTVMNSYGSIDSASDSLVALWYQA